MVGVLGLDSWEFQTYSSTPKKTLFLRKLHEKTGSWLRPSSLTMYAQAKKAIHSRPERTRKDMGMGSDQAYRTPDSSRATIRKAQAERRRKKPG